jgi:hypothetical protein
MGISVSLFLTLVAIAVIFAGAAGVFFAIKHGKEVEKSFAKTIELENQEDLLDEIITKDFRIDYSD